MIRREKLDKEERHRYSTLFSTIFYAFDMDGNSTINARELATGYDNEPLKMKDRKSIKNSNF